MRKRIIPLLLACSMVVASLAGCGSKVVDEKKEETTVVEDTKPSKDDAAADLGGITLDLESGSVIIKAPDMPYNAGDAYPIEELAKAIPTDNIRMDILSRENGNEFLMTMTMCGNNSCISMGAENADTNVSVKFDLYTVDNHLYDIITYNGTTVCKTAIVSADSDTDTLQFTESPISLDSETFKSAKFLKTANINDIDYHIIEIEQISTSEPVFIPAEGVTMIDPETGEPIENPEVPTETVYAYINAMSKRCEMISDSDYSTVDPDEVDTGVLILITDIKTIELPEICFSENVVETSADEVAMDLFGMMFSIPMVAAGVEVDEDGNLNTDGFFGETEE